jgi:dGTPase
VLDFTAETTAVHQELKRLLRHQLYEHPRVIEMAQRSQTIVRELFDSYMSHPEEMPVREVFVGAETRARAVSDYIAGMTDRFAIAEHARLHNAARMARVAGETS